MSEESVLIRAIRQIDEESEKEGWDQPSLLLIVMAHPMDTSVAVMEVATCPGWNQAMAVTDTVQHTLRVMKDVMAGVPLASKRGVFIPDVFYGLILRTETWSLYLDPEKDSPAAMKEARKASEERTIDKHPDKVESRFIYMITVDDEAIALSHDRGGEITIYDSGDGYLTGNIPALMGTLIKEIQR